MYDMNVYLLLFLIVTTVLILTIIEQQEQQQHNYAVVLVVEALIITNGNNNNGNNNNNRAQKMRSRTAIIRNGNFHHHHHHRPDNSVTTTTTTGSSLNSAATSTTTNTKSTATNTNNATTNTANTKTTTTKSNTNTNTNTNTKSNNNTIVCIPEYIWRNAALIHRQNIQKLLQPGLVSNDHPLMASIISQRKRQQKEKLRQQQQKQKLDNGEENEKDKDKEKENNDIDEDILSMTVLDPKHPVYNFLVEYYGLKGLKGPKRLARWSPSISLLLSLNSAEDDDDDDDNDNDDEDKDEDEVNNDDDVSSKTTKTRIKTITSLEELNKESSKAFLQHDDENGNGNGNDYICRKDDDGIFLEGATPNDFALILHLKGAEWIEDASDNTIFGGGSNYYKKKSGVLYRPFRCYNDDDVVFDDNDNNNNNNNNNDAAVGKTTETVNIDNNNNNNNISNNNNNNNKISSFIWYKSILETTIKSEPILHCYGLHEWAMQYHPIGVGAEPPPSSKYQQHLPLRVSREVINETVERKGLRCTHVDALRFFAPAAAPLNHHGSFLKREDQLKLEQSGCVHSHMDLLKIGLKLIPYCDSQLLVDILDIALEARTLDVSASPYDCSQYTYNLEEKSIPIIKVETAEGRLQYKELQTKLMYKTESIRKRLLMNYNIFLKLCFTSNQINIAIHNPNINEQYTYTIPGGLPWRKSSSLIDE